MPVATARARFARPDLTTFCRLDELDLVVTGQRLEPDRAVLACRVLTPDEWCRRCGAEGAARDTVIRRLAHEPLGWRPTVLEVAVRRYRCTGCGHVWRQDTTRAAEPRSKLSRRGLRWALEALVVQHLTVTRIAEGLDVAWDTANDAVLAEGRRVVYVNPGRPQGDGLIRPHPAESREPAIAACAAWQRDPCSGLVTRGFRSVARRRHGGRRRPTRLDSWRFGPRR